MPLFEGKLVTEVVTPADIRNLTGISASDFQFPNAADPETELDNLLKVWIERIASHVHTRISRSILETDDDYKAIQDIVIRTVAKLVAVAQQQRTSPVIQINDFAVAVLNTSAVTNDLAKELRPFLKRRVSFFSSLEDYVEPTE